MTVCAVKGCSNSSDKNKKESNITFHQFPTDPVINARWAEKIRLNRGDRYWKPSKISKICSIHFDNRVKYTTKGGLARLQRGAIPTKHLHINCLEDHLHSHGNLHMRVTDAKEEIQGTNEPSQNDDNVNQTTHVSFSSDDSLDSVFDSPAKARMRKQLRKKTLLQVKHTKKIRCLQKTIQKLRKKNPSLQQKPRRLKKINASLQQIIVKLRKERYINNDIFNILKEHVAEAELCNKMLKKSRKSTFIPVPQYTSEFRKFCVKLNFYSPQAYNYVTKAFNSFLPDAKTTYKWYRNNNGSPGLTNEAFEVLKLKVQASERKLLCALIADEMYLQPQKLNTYDRTLDFGAGPSRNGLNASQASTFVLVCLNQHWEVPLGYFLVHGLTGSQKKNIINMCLTECDEVGVKVVSITLIANDNSISAAQLLGCRITDPENMKTTFKHPTADHEVALFFYHTNILEHIEEHFKNKKELLDQDQNKIDWEFLIKAEKKWLYNVFRDRVKMDEYSLKDIFRSTGLANVLKDSREVRNFDDFKNSEATEFFLRMIFDLSGILNSCPYEEGLNQSLSRANKQEIFDYLEKTKKYILNLKFIHATTTQCEKESFQMQKERREEPDYVAKSAIGFKGMLVSLESLKHLHLTLVEGTRQAEHISTGRLKHEPFYDLFESIRTRAGRLVDFPTALQFTDGYKHELETMKSIGSLKHAKHIICDGEDEIELIPC